MDELARQLSELAGNSPVQLLNDPFPEPVGIRLFLKRDDLLHPLVSGNKWRKLTYNLLEAQRQHLNTLLTFGGAYSNHLYATAAAGQVFGFKTIGIVRGEELANSSRNPTLAFCESCGMTLYFISRAEYRQKDDPDFQADLINRFGPCYLIPEGGTNELAIHGTAEIIPELISQLGRIPDYVCCPVGTGGTVAGLARSAPKETVVLGFVVLKGLDLTTLYSEPIEAGLALARPRQVDYPFGGYAKTTPELIDFIRAFERKTEVKLEQIYTGKMLYGIYDLARQGYFPNEATVVAVHTGGLQGRSKELEAD
ncbi:1-aminocyclopropane-1-carboxylate deaminase/D-cysteine desulfhydrase [Spirosoma aureum]|uniref:1-aminocyclopropane-1-carboxylate deaminase/D-cysteine desulfhydrase n=1 Tax=Spirosoma aureum TaxID=2692134 RepID=A0A6G9ASZ0_9BACT|nr:pyridoxal-phosphate dependent enzyme [Spirosoma aureum]QIP15464.1 1-aminocyclopropane-1-carboxylate deaminase/D-cysteine desulfhydrase [Spirosoma aureum]